MSESNKAYFDALAELERAAVTFADAVLRAAGAAQMVDPRGERLDHPKAKRAFRVCRENLAAAFTRAPGMLQLFASAEAVEEK